MEKTFDKMFCNVLILGFSFMLIFTAFQTCGMVQNVVITSMKEDYKNYKGNGYYSLASLYAVFAFSNWFAPSIICKIGPKMSMIFGGFTYCLFLANFFIHETWCLYVASAIIGFGAAVIWTGQGNFLTINSSSETMSRNSGIFWALLQCSLLFGNLFVFFIFQGKKKIDEFTRYILFGVLLATCAAGTGLLFFLRTKTDDSVAVSSNSSVSFERPSAKEEFLKAFRLLNSKEMLLLSFCFIYTGFELSFISGVYGTGIGFTLALGSDSKKYVGLSGICIGIGEVCGGACFGLLGKKTNKYGRDPVVLLGFLSHIVSFFLVYLNLPSESPLHETHQLAIINSQAWLAMLCAIGLGFGDACYNTQLYSILGSMYPEQSAPAFTLYKFFQSVAAAAAFFYSDVLELPYQLLILVISSAIGSITFWIVEWNEHVKISKQKENLQSSTKL